MTRAQQTVMTTEEVAEYLSVPLDTVYDWRRKHVLPRAARIGKYLRYRRSEVDAWVEARSR